MAYDYLRDRDCANVIEQGGYAEAPADALYRGVGSACLAAFEARDDLWDQAEADLRRLSTSDRSVLTCYDRAAHALLKALVAAHRKDPQRAFARSSGKSVPDRCLRIKGIEPDHGPLDGNFDVVVTGSNFPTRATVVIDTRTDRLEIPARSTRGGRELRFRMPAVQEPGEALVILNAEGADTAVDFRFDPLEEEADPPEPSETGGADGSAGEDPPAESTAPPSTDEEATEPTREPSTEPTAEQS